MTTPIQSARPRGIEGFAPLSLFLPSLNTSVITGLAAGRYLYSREYLDVNMVTIVTIQYDEGGKRVSEALPARMHNCRLLWRYHARYPV